MTAKQSPHTPKFRRHKASNRGYVELNGKRFYLGDFGSSEAQQRYHQMVAEWIANGRQNPVPAAQVTIIELIDRFWKHAKRYYRRSDGTPTNEISNFRGALRILNHFYGRTKAIDFGPRCLIAVREEMIATGWGRTHINKQTGRIKHLFKWAVEQESVEPSVFHGLQAVRGLGYGRSEAPESRPVRPVPQAHVDAVRSYLSRQLWALVRL